ncbi:hypothetical protein [Desulfolutivibrio sp.]|uniref:hypothetical protein n=1 Tax=Desulfolutivibrio sp. TaxID=2773296 RepID=UPI002F96E7CE
MDTGTIATTLTILLLAAQSVAIDVAKGVATELATKLATKLGTSGLRNLYNMVKRYFTKDGEGAVTKLAELEKNPTSPQAQEAVKGRLLMLLQENPAFLAEIKAIIGDIRVDQSINQTATSGDHSPITQVVGHNNVIK